MSLTEKQEAAIASLNAFPPMSDEAYEAYREGFRNDDMTSQVEVPQKLAIDRLKVFEE